MIFDKLNNEKLCQDVFLSIIYILDFKSIRNLYLSHKNFYFTPNSIKIIASWYDLHEVYVFNNLNNILYSNYNPNTALKFGVRSSDYKIVETSIRNDANNIILNLQYCTNFNIAKLLYKNRHKDEIFVSLENKIEKEILFMTSFYGNLEEVKEFVDNNNIDINKEVTSLDIYEDFKYEECYNKENNKISFAIESAAKSSSTFKDSLWECGTYSKRTK